MSQNYITKTLISAALAGLIACTSIIPVFAARGETTTIATSEAHTDIAIVDTTDVFNEDITYEDSSTEVTNNNPTEKTSSEKVSETTEPTTTTEEIYTPPESCDITIKLSGTALVKKITMIVKHIETNKKYSLTFLRENDYTLSATLPTGSYSVEKIESNEESLVFELVDSSFGVPYFETADITVTLNASVYQETPLDLLKDNAFFICALLAGGIALFVIQQRKKRLVQ